MTYCNAGTTLRPRLRVSRRLWRELVADLARRGAGIRESGAFLLGAVGKDERTVRQFIAYEDIDPHVQDFDHVSLSSIAFANLWELCARRQLAVVADVHTHPGGPRQSRSDRANPMVAVTGHVALIVPNFAQGHVEPQDVSVNVYAGAHRWTSYLGPEAATAIEFCEE